MVASLSKYFHRLLKRSTNWRMRMKKSRATVNTGRNCRSE
jgi:hypothetical protein